MCLQYRLVYCWTDSENIQSNDNNIEEKIISESLVLLPVLPVWHQLPFILDYIYETMYRPNSLRIGRQYFSSVFSAKEGFTYCLFPSKAKSRLAFIHTYMYVCLRLSYPKLTVLLKCHSLCMYHSFGHFYVTPVGLRFKGNWCIHRYFHDICRAVSNTVLCLWSKSHIHNFCQDSLKYNRLTW